MFRLFSSQSLRSRAGQVMPRLGRLVAWIALLGFIAASTGLASAQPSVANKAGLVVDFGGGAVYTTCVDLGADGQATGEEVLAAAGYDVLMEYSAMGGAVCRINTQGCAYPDQPCWCQCMSSPCVYWAYHHLVNGQWSYSTQGASTYVVQSGAVEGWAWGEGTLAQGAQPPVYTFDQLCSPPTATSTPTATATPLPTSTPTATPTPFSMTFPTEPWTPPPTATWTSQPTATWTPSATSTWTPAATATPLPSQTVSGTPASMFTWTPTPLPSTVAPAAPSATPVAVAQAFPEAATQTPLPASPLPEPAAAPLAPQPDRVYLPALEHGTGRAAAQPQALAQALPSDTPTPPATPTLVLVAAVSGSSSSGKGGPGDAAGSQRSSSLPPRLDPNARHSAAPRSSVASLTAAKPDLAAMAVLVLAMSAGFAVARTARRGRRCGVHRPNLQRRLVALKLTMRALAAILFAVRRAPDDRSTGAREEAGDQPARLSHSQTEIAENPPPPSLLPPSSFLLPPSSFLLPPSSFPLPPSRLLSASIYALTASIGLLALLNPFLSAALHPGSPPASGANTPLLMTVLVALCFLSLLFEVQGQAVSAKMIALLGVLVAINSVLRFVEVSIPGPGGFTPIFFLIILTGYVFGGRFGFLMGALTLLVSALITGGVGPWLPGQMFTAGWMGLLAPLARPLVRVVGGRPGSRAELAVLAGYAGLCGLFYGVVINLWFWPYMTGPADQYWQAGVSLAGTLQRYAAYYLATSLVWDVFAVAGNVLLVVAFGAATLRALHRFRQRFDFEYEPGEQVAGGTKPRSCARLRQPRSASEVGEAEWRWQMADRGWLKNAGKTELRSEQVGVRSGSWLRGTLKSGQSEQMEGGEPT